MLVVPDSIRTLEGDIRETVIGSPVHDSRSPAERNLPELELITDLNIFPHRSRRRFGDGEVEFWRSDLLEIKGVTEKFESGLNGDREPSRSVELVKAHG